MEIITDITKALADADCTFTVKVIKEADDIMSNLRKDMARLTNVQADIKADIVAHFDKLKEVSKEARDLITCIKETSSELIDTTLPSLKESVEKEDAVNTAEWLEFWSMDMQPTVTRFGYFISSNEVLHKGMESSTLKVDELKKEAEMKEEISGNLTEIVGMVAVGGFIAVSMGGFLVGAGIAGASTGTGMLCSGGLCSGMATELYKFGNVYKKTCEGIKEEMEIIASALNNVITMLKVQMKSFKDIQQALLFASNSFKKMKKFSESGDKVRLLRAIDASIEKFSTLQQHCTDYLSNLSMPLPELPEPEAGSSSNTLSLQFDGLAVDEKPVIDLD